MPTTYFHDGSPMIRMCYNASGSSIPKGTAITRDITTVTAIADPAREDGTVTVNVFSITPMLAADTTDEQSNFIGVAHEIIPDSDWGQVCIGGPCEVLVNTSVTWAVGDDMAVGTTLGAFIASATPYAMVPATVTEAKVTTATANWLVKAFIEPVRQIGGSGHSAK